MLAPKPLPGPPVSPAANKRIPILRPFLIRRRLIERHSLSAYDVLPAIAIGGSDDLVVEFLYELDVVRKFNRPRRSQRQSEAPQQMFLFVGRNILRRYHAFELFFECRRLVREYL